VTSCVQGILKHPTKIRAPAVPGVIDRAVVWWPGTGLRRIPKAPATFVRYLVRIVWTRGRSLLPHRTVATACDDAQRRSRFAMLLICSCYGSLRVRRGAQVTIGGASGASGGSGPPGRPEPLTASDFAARFEASFRLLWTIASGITGDRSTAEDVVQDAAVIALGKLSEFDPGTSFNAWMGQIVRFVALNHARKHQRRRTTSLEDMDQAVMSLRGDRSDRRDNEGRAGEALGSESSPPAGTSDEPEGGGPPSDDERSRAQAGPHTSRQTSTSADHRRPDALARSGGDIAGPLRLHASGRLPDGQQEFDDEIVQALGELSATARACMLLRTVENLTYRDIARILDIPEGTAMSHVHRTRTLLRRKLGHRWAGGTTGAAKETETAAMSECDPRATERPDDEGDTRQTGGGKA